MKGHPAPDAHAERRDLVFPKAARDPDADPAFASFPFDVEQGQGLDQPLLQIADEGADIGFAVFQIEHHIAHALARPVIGELAAPSGAVDGKPRINQVCVIGAGAGGVDGRVFQ